jgi:hypothetical protein
MAKHNELCPGHATDVAPNRLPVKGIMRVHDPITAQAVLDTYNTKVAADTGNTSNVFQCTVQHLYIGANHSFRYVQNGGANARPPMVMQQSDACKVSLMSIAYHCCCIDYLVTNGNVASLCI